MSQQRTGGQLRHKFRSKEATLKPGESSVCRDGVLVLRPEGAGEDKAGDAIRNRGSQRHSRLQGGLSDPGHKAIELILSTTWEISFETKFKRSVNPMWVGCIFMAKFIFRKLREEPIPKCARASLYY